MAGYTVFGIGVVAMFILSINSTVILMLAGIPVVFRMPRSSKTVAK
jgi:hypothetical protein